jgi:hypothetical protein
MAAGDIVEPIIFASPTVDEVTGLLGGLPGAVALFVVLVAV